MNKKLTALLALVLVVSVGMVTALAEEHTKEIVYSVLGSDTGESVQVEVDVPAGAEDTELPVEDDAPVFEEPEVVGHLVTFGEIAEMVGEKNLAYKALLSQIDYIDAAGEFVEDLEDQLWDVNRVIASLSADPEGNQAQLAAMQAQQMQLQGAISQFSAIAQQDTTKLEAGCQQIIMQSEMLYGTIVGLELQKTALERQLTALDRKQAEMKVRQEYGQVSALQVMELESGRNTLVSNLKTLRVNISSLGMQLEQLIGDDVTGTLRVGTLPRVTAEQLNAIDLEKDLLRVLRINPDVRAAEEANRSVMSMGVGSMSSDMWNSITDANDYTLENAKLQAEASFRGLYTKLQNCQQVVETAKRALEIEQLSYDAAALKYEQGLIAQNALLDAEDELQTAKEAVVTAENDLFTAYNQYDWAVRQGIFSQQGAK